MTEKITIEVPEALARQLAERAGVMERVTEDEDGEPITVTPTLDEVRVAVRGLFVNLATKRIAVEEARKARKQAQEQVRQDIKETMQEEKDNPDDAWWVQPDIPEWKVGVSYSVGDKVIYDGVTYECRQAHTSQSDWTPPKTLALWLPIEE